MDCHLSKCAGTRARFELEPAILCLAMMVVLLATGAAGCGDAGRSAPDDPLIATSTPAESAKPMYMASSADGIWVLELLDGQPIFEESTITLRISGNQLTVSTGAIAMEGYLRRKRPSPVQTGYFHVRPSHVRRKDVSSRITRTRTSSWTRGTHTCQLSDEVRDTGLQAAGWRYWTVRAQPGWYSSARRRSQDNPSTFAAPRGVSSRTTTRTTTNV